MLGVFAVACATRAGVRPLAAAVGRRRPAASCRRSTCSASGSRSCSRSSSSASMRGRSPRKSRQLADALAATELVLAREQHLSQLDGLAAAAAHELGTPLSTISVIAQGTRARDRAELAACRRRAAAARAGAALPRHSRQAHRTVVRRRAVRPAAAVRADRGGGRAAPPFRHRDRRRAARTSRDRAGRRAQSGDPLRPRQSGRERRRFRPRARRDRGATGATRTSRSRSATTARASRRRSSTGSASPMSRSRRRRRMNAGGEPAGLGLGFFIAKTLLERSGATLDLRQPAAARPRRRRHGPLAARATSSGRCGSPPSLSLSRGSYLSCQIRASMRMTCP